MPKKKLFPRPEPGHEISITINVDLGEDSYKLLHVLSEPTAEDKKEYQRRSIYSELSGRDRKIVTNTGAAFEWLWTKCIKRVDGYETEEVKDFKDAVPLEHKIWAGDALLNRAGTLKEADQKN
ncbi:hypothetical protein LCGC14_1908220 [marine sediment metagenome]|uniref:Uncharacterized protein n=1 Tax=marine sediment metagenome TaxID=412755 RepID=A0A0F9FUF8_9ZZZZ